MSLVSIDVGGGRTVYKPSHQACPDPGKLPRYVVIQRATALPSAWSGSETFVDFEIPQSMSV